MTLVLAGTQSDTEMSLHNALLRFLFAGSLLTALSLTGPNSNPSMPNKFDTGDAGTKRHSAALPCRLKQLPLAPSALITWYKDGVKLLNASEHRQTMWQMGDTYPDLNIHSVEEHDAGTYFCRVSTQVGTTDGQVSVLATQEKLWLLVTGPVITWSQKKQLLTYSWTCIGSGVEDLNWNTTDLIQEGSPPVKINVTRSDSRTYSDFKVQQPQGGADVEDFCLHCSGSCNNKTSITTPCLKSSVFSPYKPKLDNGPHTTFKVIPGSTVTLPCSATSIPPVHSFRWLVNNFFLQGMTHRVSGGTLRHPSLTIRQVGMKDRGAYICMAINDVGASVGAVLTLQLIGPPDINDKTIHALYYTPGSVVVLPCNVESSFPILEITWYKNGRRLIVDKSSSDNDRMSGGTPHNPSLTIDFSQSGDAGIYLCSATNNYGTTNATTPLMLKIRRVIPPGTPVLESRTVVPTVTLPLVATIIIISVCALWIVARKALLRKWCPSVRWSTNWASKKSGCQVSGLDFASLGHASMEGVIIKHAMAVKEHTGMAREKCQDLLPLMDPKNVKVTLLALAHNLPLHLLPHLGQTSPVTVTHVSSGPPKWCVCGLCEATKRKENQVCCRRQECVTKTAMFMDLCMKPHVLEIVGLQNGQERCRLEETKQTEEEKEEKDKEPDFSPRMFREQALKFFLLWKWGRSGSKHLLVPSCVLVRIHGAYPDNRHIHVQRK